MAAKAFYDEEMTSEKAKAVLASKSATPRGPYQAGFAYELPNAFWAHLKPLGGGRAQLKIFPGKCPC